MSSRDFKLAVRARRHGAKHAFVIVRQARAAGVPLSWAFALIEQETGFRNVFGGDHGKLAQPRRAPFYHVRVTRRRVKALLDWIAAGGTSNGVGLPQLTWPPLIRHAETLGGAHKPRHQLHVGLLYFKDVTAGDYDHRAWKYNGAEAYQGQIAAKERRWAGLLDRRVRYRFFHRWMLNGHPANVTWRVKRAIVRGVNHGLYVTSTTDGTHAIGSWHYAKPKGRAVDLAHQDRDVMVRFQVSEHGRGAGRYRELFGPDNEHWIKDGRQIDAVEGTALEQQHDTHVHVAL